LEADGEAEVRAAARGQLKAGANCLKIMSTGGRMTPGTNTTVAQYTVAQLAAAVEEAARANVPLAAHALGTEGIRNATTAGVTTIEHCNWLGPDGEVQFDESVAKEMAARGVAVVATLTPLQRSAPALREQIMACMRRMREVGVAFVAGTDAGVSLLPFDSLPRELEIMVEDVGMTPLEAIRAATGRSAEVLGISNVGTLEPGRYADMLVLEGDPSVRIGDLRLQRMVFKGGAIAAENGLLLV
jgi:imidazolonepropionase-like amidohydrolase